MALNKPNGDMLDVAGNATPQALGTAAAGTSINCSREDHVHALPTISLGSGVSGTLPVANGGTGQTAYTDGQLLIGNSSTGGLTKAAITAGSNVTVTNGNGSISVAAAVGLGSNTFTGTQVWAVGTTSLSPARFQAGVVLSTPTAHSIEWDGTSMYTTTSTAERRTMLGYTGTPTAGQWLTWDGTNNKFVPNTNAVINSSGNTGLGTTPLFSSRLSVANSNANAQTVAIYNSGATPTNFFMSFAAGATYSEKGYITWNGTSVAITQASDARLKENIVDAPTALPKLESIKIRSFDFKEDGRHVEYGVVAQELIEVLPSAVFHGIDNEDGTINKPWSVGLEPLIPVLIKAVQELQAKVSALEAR